MMMLTEIHKARLRLAEAEEVYAAAGKEKADPCHIQQACKMSVLGEVRSHAENNLLLHYESALAAEGRASSDRLKFVSWVRTDMISGAERRSVVADAKKFVDREPADVEL